MRLLDTHEFGTAQQREHLRHFLANDDGKDFVMVNLLHLKAPLARIAKKARGLPEDFPGCTAT